MERFCSKCGTLVSGEGAFCPQCGAPLESAVDLSKSEPVSQPVYSQPMESQPVNSQPVYSQPAYTQPAQNYNPNQAAMPNYPQNYNAAPTEQSNEMTTGQWALTIFLTAFFPIGIVSWILLFVWGFGNTPQPKKNYCRGMLIMKAICVGLVILIYIGMFACIGTAVGDFSDIFDEIYY